MNVPVYAAFQQGDSIHAAILFLFAELKKANVPGYFIGAPSQYAQKGILILKTSQATQQKVNIPSKLLSSGPEGIYITGDSKSVIIIGNSGLALQEAVFMYLEQLGFRYYLPGEVWKIIPEKINLYKKINIVTSPDYVWRNIANGHGFGGRDSIEADYYSWYKANRLGGSFKMWLGHAYDEIVSNNIKEFKEHPEYFAGTLKKGETPAVPKFNVANKDLVKLVIKDALHRYDQMMSFNSSQIVLSMEPSDGGGFCTTDECKAIGSPTDQVFYLANKVAVALREKHPEAWVGSLAYNEHIVPANIKLEPNVYVQVTNGFNRSKYTTTELISIWNKKAGKVGVYEYLSVFEWDGDMPGQVYAGNPAFLKKSINYYFNSGARAYEAESVMGWINKGLGQYLASRLLWNRNVNIDSIKNDFFTLAFEDAAPEASKVFTAWESYPYKFPIDHDLADWLSLIQEAWKKTPKVKVKARLDQVKIYLHYLILDRNLKINRTKENLLTILSYAWRNFNADNASIAALPAMVSLPLYSGFTELGWYAAKDQEWKKNRTPYTNNELQRDILNDLKLVHKMPAVKKFQPSSSFIKLSDIANTTDKKYYESGHAYYGVYGVTDFIININSQSADNFYEMKSGLAAEPPKEKNVSVKIYPLKPVDTDYDALKPLLSFEQSKGLVKEKFSLGSLKPGFYFVRVNDVRKMFVPQFSKNIYVSIVMKPKEQILTTSAAGLNTYYFYVPQGVTNFRLIKSNALTLNSPTGRKIEFQVIREETANIEIKPGEEGIWTISGQGGSVFIDGVPPYLGNSPVNMLVPSYVKK